MDDNRGQHPQLPYTVSEDMNLIIIWTILTIVIPLIRLGEELDLRDWFPTINPQDMLTIPYSKSNHTVNLLLGHCLKFTWGIKTHTKIR